MSKISIKTRRMAGAISARLPVIGLAQVTAQVTDPRNARCIRWKSLYPLLVAPLVAMMAGMKSFAGTESPTEEMSWAMRKKLGIPGRISNTTMRNTMVRVSPAELRKYLYRQAKAVHRRKALMPEGFPFGVAAYDGKYTSIESFDDEYSQKQSAKDGQKAHGVVRTFNCSLVSCGAKMVVDSSPIPSHTNEMGHF